MLHATLLISALTQIAALVLATRYLKAISFRSIALPVTVVLSLVLIADLSLVAELVGEGDPNPSELFLSLALSAALFSAVNFAGPRLRAAAETNAALRRSQERFRRLVDSMDDVVFEMDREGRYAGMYGGWMRERDTSYEEYVGKRPADLFAKETADFFEETNRRALRGERVSYEKWVRYRWGTACQQTSLSPLTDEAGRTVGVVGVARDITRLKLAEKELQRQRDYAEMLVETANVMVIGVDAQGRIELLNQAAEEMTGYSRDELMGEEWFEVMMPPQTNPELWTWFNDRRERGVSEAEGPVVRGSREIPIVTKDGRSRLISWQYSVHQEDGRFAGVVAFGVDVTESRDREQELKHLATHDTLTGLPNRRSLENAVERAVSRAQRGRPSALLFMDVDNFKLCNDRYGHPFGDRVLVDIGKTLSAEIRAPDMVARLGGDEFAVLLDGATVEETNAVAERLCDAVAAVDACSVGLTLSVGVASIDGATDFEDVYTGADTAMYRAKTSDERIVFSQA
jgi:diguanylate cyclase (GGDEF)-like protein/PAS domain S-box-containing protein